MVGIGNNGTANFHERFFVVGWESVLNSNTANALHFQWSRDLETDSANAPGPGVSMSTSIGTYGETSALPREAEPDEHRWQIADTISPDPRTSHPEGRRRSQFHPRDHDQSLPGGRQLHLLGRGIRRVRQLGPGCLWRQRRGALSSFTQVVDPITHLGEDNFWNKNLAAFAEDSYKMTPKLTLTAGLRWDLQLVPQPPRPYTTSANGVASPLGASVTSTINTNYKMIQPRIGFAWNPFPTSVVRGGYGMFYGLIPLSSYYNVRVENGVFQQQYNLSAGGAGAPTDLNVLFTPPGPPLAAPFTGALTPTPIGVPPARRSARTACLRPSPSPILIPATSRLSSS